MSKPVTRQKKTRTWRSGRPIVAWGAGDAELLMFARLAVAEQRLGSSLARAKAAQTLPGPASVLHRGEQQ
jgi:hypothetical protein